jgi:cyclophilin family peptidyl-prolyl cis-trans isomerase/HEAT repeat protein
MRRALSAVLFSMLPALLAASCAAPARRPATAPMMSPAQVPDLELRSLLLYLVDRQEYEPVSVQQALAGGPALRETLAMDLGRIPDRQARSPLVGLLLDDQANVRRAAAFSLGLLGDPDAKDALIKATRDPDRETAQLAVEALGRLKVPVVEVLEALLPLPEEERWARILPYLFRFHDDAVVRLAEHGLTLADPELHARSAYALAREPKPEAADLLRKLLADPDPQVRGWAARGVGLVGGTGDLARLRPLLDDAAAGPAIQALRAAQKLIQGKKEEAAADWRPRLRALLDDPRPGVRLTVLEVAGAWPLGDAADPLAAELADRAEKGEGRERGAALLALVAGGHPRAAELARTAAQAQDADLRARVAEAAGRLADTAGKLADPVRRELLDRLAADPAPAVRSAALDARLAAAGDDKTAGAALVAAALADADAGVRATALGWLAEHPVAPLASLDQAVGTAIRKGEGEEIGAGIQALAARAAAEPLERGAIVGLLEKIAGGGAGGGYVMRRQAGEALAGLGRTAPPLGPNETGRPVTAYREIVERTWQPRTVEVRTSRGAFRIRLACPDAPLTCLSFLQLVGQGFYDGLPFHRVVPDFVVQGGDPRGDGLGGPGYEIRDEINRLRYRRGTVGMALAGPDTGGSQFFVALSPQPHLDGGYTAFGEVVAGEEVLDRIVPGDRIEKIVEVGSDAR